MLHRDIFDLIDKEHNRQMQHIELIASENYVSRDVLLAQGSILTNKYAEGYPGKRYYGGCHFVDEIENIAINRAKELFGAEYANVQPHSGSQANQIVYFAVLKPGDTVLGMKLDHGGHLTHGSPVNLSGKLFNFVNYGLNEQEEIDYDQLMQLAKIHQPKLIIAGASSYSREIDFAKFKTIADSVGAYLMVDMAHYSGLIAAGIYPDPIPFADFVTSTTHKTLRGPRGGLILAKQKYEKLINASNFPSIQGGPLLHIIAAKAICFKEAMSPQFLDYQKQVKLNASTMAKHFQSRGVRVVSNGTDSHMFCVDLRSIDQNLTGKFVEDLLSLANITLNKNMIPNDPKIPSLASGIRIGTPAVTTRKFNEHDCIHTVDLIIDLINAHLECENDINRVDHTLLEQSIMRVKKLLSSHMEF